MSREEKQHFARPSQALDLTQWREIVDGWNPSTESQKNYCKRLGININTFTYVRSKLLGSKKPASTFVPVLLNNHEEQDLGKAKAIIIENKQGFKLSIPLSLPLEQLAQILRLCGWRDA